MPGAHIEVSATLGESILVAGQASACSGEAGSRGKRVPGTERQAAPDRGGALNAEDELHVRLEKTDL